MFFINFSKERYCFKCHKLKQLNEFTRKLSFFRYAGKCMNCQIKDKLHARH